MSPLNITPCDFLGQFDIHSENHFYPEAAIPRVYFFSFTDKCLF